MLILLAFFTPTKTCTTTVDLSQEARGGGYINVFILLPVLKPINTACNGINETGQDRIIVVERRNGTGQDISQRLKRRTGQDRISHRSAGRDGTGFVS